MATEVAIYRIPNHRRSRVVCEAMGTGIRKSGDKTVVIDSSGYARNDAKRVAVFYGMRPPLDRLIPEAREDGRKSVYIDLGYWGRHDGGRWRGFHKVSVNGRHPTEYFMRREHDDIRAKALGLKLEPWKKGGRHILVVGMSGRSCAIDGYQPNQWERETIARLKEVTDRPIIYRPKPSWLGAVPLEGASYSPKMQQLAEVLAGCHAVVTHHSNVAVDALVAGIPAFCWEGIATPLSLQDLARIEAPLYSEARTRWLNAATYCQWSVAEMADGAAWRHLKAEGLV